MLTMLCMVALGGGGANAQTAETIGLTQSYSSTDKIFTAPVFSGTSDGSVTNGGESHGSECGFFNPSNKSRTVVDATGTSPVSYAGNHYCWRKTVSGTDYSANQWVGYQLTIKEGKTFSITGAHAEIFVGDDTYTWKLQIAKGTDVLYQSENQTASKTVTSNLDVDLSSNAEALAKLKNLTGDITVRIYMYQKGSQKYFVIPYLTVTGTVAENTKATYSVTATANPENAGTIVGAGSYSEGDAVSVTATPATGYKFVNWTVGEGQTSTDNPYTVASLAGDLNLVANFEALPKITFEKGDGEGTAPAVAYVEKGTNYSIPASYFLKKDGYTLTGWSDGTNTYAAGSTLTVTGDVTLTPVFTANTVKLGDAAVNVVWNFDKSNGAPIVAFQGNEGDYVEQVSINDAKLDVVMHINTTADGAKVNNETNDSKAQVNGGTIFTLPAVKGMVVSISNANDFTATTIAGTTEYEGKGTNSISYTYDGSDPTIDIVIGESQYIPAIEVSYPGPAATSETASITSAGYATYVTKNIVDLSSNANVKAFTAKYDAASSTITLTPTKATVPAGTALVLKGAEGSYDFTVGATAEEVANNDLKATTEPLTADGSQWILAKLGDQVGFAPATPETTIPAGKAYLVIKGSASSKGFIGISDGDATGINQISASQNTLNENAPMFNLAGQQVTKAYKGVILQNGKKFINK